MKLYSEEQVKIAIDEARLVDILYRTHEEVLKLLTPIELPSGDEIANELQKVIGHVGEPDQRGLCFIGALWLKDRILNQIDNEN